MSDANGAAPAATPANFSAAIAANVQRASAQPATPAPAQPAMPAPAPPTGGAPATGGIRHGVPAGTPAAPAPADPAAAFDAALQAAQQPPANDNAQDPNAELAALQGEQPPDPFAEQIHGLELRAIVDAIKQGQLPAQLLEQLKVTTKVGGRELPISVEEARRGYMRLSDYTQETQRTAAQQQQLEGVKQQLRGLFDGWDKPEGFEQGMFRMGLVQNARALVTKNWGNPQQPNPQGLLDDMRRLGHWDTFKQAAELYANQWAAEQQMDPAVRADLQRQRDEMWRARLAAETEVETSKRKAWEQEKEKLLAQSKQRQNPQQQAQAMQQLRQLKTAAFQQHGIKPSPAADTYFDQNCAAIRRMAERRGERVTAQQIIQQAAQATAEQLGDVQYQHAQSLGNGAQPAATAQPAQPQAALPARPAAAPVTAPSQLKRGGTHADFLDRVGTLNRMTGR